jgi:putative ABC transport system permease protein
MATTVVLLIGAGLLIRSFYRLQNVNPGFSYEHLTSFSMSLPQKKYPAEDQRAEFYRRAVEDIRPLPGVEAVAAATGLPLGNNGWQTAFVVEGKPLPPREQTPLMEACSVTADYFRVMNIPLLRGRYFTQQDNRAFLAGRDTSKMNDGERMIRGANVIVIDEEFARRHWPDEEALGKQIRLGREPDSQRLTVIGIVGRVKMDSLRDDSNRVQGYFSAAQLPMTSMAVIIKATGDPTQLVASARQQVKNIDPDQPIYGIRTMNEIRSDSIAPERLNLTLMGIFAGIALVLAVVGIYGVMSYSVTQRTHEIGIRMAIGAQPTDVFRMILGHGMKLALIGVGLGLIGAYALTRLMATMLFGVEPTDKVTFASIAVILTIVALLACYLPGRRATKVEPVISLRYE